MSSIIIVGGMALVLFVVAWRLPGRKHIEGARQAADLLIVNLPRVLLALLSAGFLSQLVPEEIIGSWLGGASGLTGILVATVLGTIMPGGPLIAFPIVVILLKAGAGMPALVTFLTAWSVLGVQRIISFELPMMGSKFVLNRVAIGVFLPPLSGGIVYLLDFVL